MRSTGSGSFHPTRRRSREPCIVRRETRSRVARAPPSRHEPMSDAGLPTLRVTGAVNSALAPEVLATLGVPDLARFLTHRRWFAGKGRTVTSTMLHDIVPLAWASYRAAAVRLEVELDDGASAEYQLLLAALPTSALPPSYAPIARVDSQEEGEGFLIDATEDPRFRSLLGSAFELGAVFVTNHARWSVEP